MKTQRRAFAVRLLQVPLAAKLVGAQAIVLALCGGLVVSLGWRPHDAGEVALIAIAATAGLPITILLVELALRPLRQLEATAHRVGEGDYTARVPGSVLADRKMNRLAGTLNTLLDRVTDDRSNLKDLASEAIRAGEEERKRAAVRLHESAAQSIASVSWQLGALARDADDDELQHRLLFIKRVTEDVLEDVRKLAEGMHPRVLSDLGLGAALSQLARQCEAESGVRVTAHVDRSIARSIDQAAAFALYRTAFEATWNAIQHARASSIRIWLFKDEGVIRLEVIDDGQGFDVRATERRKHGGRGIFGLRDRMVLVNGNLVVESTIGSGTRVCAYIQNQPVGAERSA
jgi:signal transduction histidine kinase